MSHDSNSEIKNSVVHHSPAWALKIQSSTAITVHNSSFIGAKAIGVNLLSIQNVHLNGVFVGDVTRREELAESLDSQVDKEACVAFCSYNQLSYCAQNSIQNSVAAGCPFGGFVAPGHLCEDYADRTFYNNVAHSVDGSGAYIYPNPLASAHRQCYEGSHFTAYKNQEQGVCTMYRTKDLRMSHMTLIDNQKGGLNLNAQGESDTQVINATNIAIFGEGEEMAEDCPSGEEDCLCSDKMGLMLFGGSQAPKQLHPLKASSLPIYKIKSYATFRMKVELDNVSFTDFTSTPASCPDNRNYVLGRNPYAADYIPMHTFKNTAFTNVDDEARVWLEDPDPRWAATDPLTTPDNCADWPCTAPSNIVLRFEDEGLAKSQIVSNNGDAATHFPRCSLKSEWNAYECIDDEPTLAVLIFESLDADNEDREV